jgi:predicted nucleotidyltransferase
VNDLQAALQRAARHLDELDVQWALVGGLAVSARATPRTTRDVDVALATANDQEAESLTFRLGALGYRSVAVVEQLLTGRMATARLRVPGASGLILDLLFASCGIEPEIARDAELLEVLPGLTVRVARVGHLLAMKLLARDDRRRPQDADDLRALLEVADAAERRRCEDALDLITARQCNRERDLRASWRALLEGA